MEDMRPTKYIHGELNAAEDGSLSCTTERREIKDLADSKERKDYLMKWIENGGKVSAEVNFHVS
jgi:hypothetical protein